MYIVKVNWVEQDGYYELHFEPYYEDLIIAKLTPSKDGEWIYVSNLLNVEYDEIYAASLQEAKEEIENKVEEHYQDQANYYDELLEKFKDRDN